jgi:hypothetical protein
MTFLTGTGMTGKVLNSAKQKGKIDSLSFEAVFPGEEEAKAKKRRKASCNQDNNRAAFHGEFRGSCRVVLVPAIPYYSTHCGRPATRQI